MQHYKVFWYVGPCWEVGDKNVVLLTFDRSLVLQLHSTYHTSDFYFAVMCQSCVPTLAANFVNVFSVFINSITINSFRSLRQIKRVCTKYAVALSILY